MTWRASGGIPARSPASRRISTARSEQPAARAEGRKMIALRVFAATIALNRIVDVGLVIGVSASTTPIGSATYWIAALGVLVDHADGALVLQVVVEELGGDVVLDHLVLEHAEAGLLHRQPRELDGVLQPCDDERPDDPVDGLLVVDAAECVRRGARARDDLVEPFELFVVEARRRCGSRAVTDTTQPPYVRRDVIPMSVTVSRRRSITV